MNKSMTTTKSLSEVWKGMIADMREKQEKGDFWEIQKDGTMVHKTPYYYIDGSRLDEDWIVHMSRKNWVDMKEFIRAYLTACRVRGIKMVNIRTDQLF